jgi:hypothetical protein
MIHGIDAMGLDDCTMPQLVSQLKTAQFQTYLLTHGWVETSSRYIDHLRFEGDMHDGEGVYELYVPISTSVPKYRTRLMRCITKLCGIEDREPADIARDIFAGPAAGESTTMTVAVTRLRVQNSGTGPLRLSIEEPSRDHTLLAGEAIELNCDVGAGQSIELERGDGTLVVRAMPHRPALSVPPSKP